ncbi:WD repeat-containing protein 89 [Drosophila mojavensis]|uniref:WD repeat-containing protein 89 n=1 Tax=Drosophila mojavensis TaxID=7230 RepID=B4KTH7_DROMO|nr:WD repeat-containing protein 89 [Drosophila mojavensis]EDW05479.1 uncharacterized protein Dmoj_GI14544 [Drosophila mojavensis]EDW08538.1 uncharacterized protein Dmoj_GI20019 [Drosophila mojavensis]
MSVNEYIAEAAAIELPSSEDEPDTEQAEDADVCSDQQLANEFRVHYIKDEASLGFEQSYILSLTASTDFTRLAVGQNIPAVKIYDLSKGGELTQIQELVPRSLPLKKRGREAFNRGVRFLEDNGNTLLAGYSNGQVKLFDLRTPVEQATFMSEFVPPVPPSIRCFDRNANSRILCCGTKLTTSAYLLFFDIRKRKELGSYCESHSDDITSVRFHDTYPDLLCTGSTDGLINVFDIKESDEDEALKNTINTESSVHRLNWHQDANNKEVITCITHTNDFKSYECLEGDDWLSFKRSEIVAGIRRKSPANFNLINAHTMLDKGLFLLAGTNFHRGEVLRSVIAPAKGLLKPFTNYVGNKQVVRESLYDAKRDLLITSGETGLISIWTSDASDVKSNDNLRKMRFAKSRKSTPY